MNLESNNVVTKKLMINSEEYKQRLNKLLYRFPLELLITANLILGFVQLIVLKNGSEVLANVFFQATIVTVLVYFGKSKLLESVFKVSPEDFTKEPVKGYLPCVLGTWMHQYQAGFLVIEGKVLRFYGKKIDGFIVIHEWKDITLVKVKTDRNPMNIFMILLFGLSESIEISDGTKTQKVLFPSPKESVKEIEHFLKSLI